MIYSSHSTSGQIKKPPATLAKIKVEVKIKPVAKSKKICHLTLYMKKALKISGLSQLYL